MSYCYRVGDTYPNQMLQVQVRAYFYRWKPHVTMEGEEWPFTAWELKITDGLMSVNQLLLRMPTTMVHVIDDDSPLAAWRTGRAAVATDSDSEVVVVVSSKFLCATYNPFAHLYLIGACTPKGWVKAWVVPQVAAAVAACLQFGTGALPIWQWHPYIWLVF